MATRRLLKDVLRGGTKIALILFATAAFHLIAASAAAAQSQEMVLQFSPDRSSVEFALGATFHTVHGAFNLKSGTTHFTPSTGALSGEIVVDAASGRSGNSGRDSRMHKEILETARYPEITFLPDRVEGKVEPQGASNVQVHGMFGIHGSVHEITIPVKVEIHNGRWSATSHFVIPYAQWGIKNPSNFLLHLKPTVDIEVHVAGTIPAETNASR